MKKKRTLDVIVDLQYGDCGKGKISHYLVGKRGYTHVMRYNGGANAGHTIYHKGKKWATNQIPAGVFYGVPSVIGPGCVVHVQGLLEEIATLERGGIRTKGRVLVARNAHIVTEDILKAESNEKAIGTTKQGIGPTYAAKALRTGIRAESVPELAPYLVDMYEYFYGKKAEKRAPIILAEGAQGFGLDIDWGDYPFVTSSHCTVAGALTNGFTHTDVREVWGVAKAYETYVGAKKFEPNEPIFTKLRELGGEFGVVTGRPRQCDWLHMDLLVQAVRMNGVTHVVINKMDILEQLGTYALYDGKKKKMFKNAADFERFIRDRLVDVGVSSKNIFFSRSPERI